MYVILLRSFPSAPERRLRPHLTYIHTYGARGIVIPSCLIWSVVVSYVHTCSTYIRTYALSVYVYNTVVTARRGMATQSAKATGGVESTQNRQYDDIGSKYGDIKVKPAVQPERPSVLAVLGDVRGKRCLGRSLTLVFCSSVCSPHQTGGCMRSL